MSRGGKNNKFVLDTFRSAHRRTAAARIEASKSAERAEVVRRAREELERQREEYIALDSALLLSEAKKNWAEEVGKWNETFFSALL